MASDDTRSMKSEGFPIESEDGEDLHEHYLHDMELDLGMVAEDLARLPGLVSDACALSFGEADYTAVGQTLALYIDGDTRVVRVDDSDQDATQIAGYRAVLAEINRALDGTGADLRVALVGFTDGDDDMVWNLRAVCVPSARLDAVAAMPGPQARPRIVAGYASTGS